MDYAWTCGCCGKQFNNLPLDRAFQSPDPWFSLTDAERATRGKIDADVCALDGEIFVRVCLEIPIIGYDDRFIWGVWVSVSRQSFGRILELWTASDVTGEPPLSASLCNNIPLYPTTYGLKANIHLRPSPERPSVRLERTDHPLAIEQWNGITFARVEEIAARLHQPSGVQSS